jgi:GTP-binding protein
MPRSLSPNALFSGPCVFVAGAPDVEHLPSSPLPEVAFAGRSNVGKSTLINALVGHKGLARASSTPGRTRHINLFRLADTLMLADLPGYGYAKASRSDVAQWMRLVREYLTERSNLRRVLLLIDARHGVKNSDEEAMELLDTVAMSYQLVLTKSDKPRPAELAQVMVATQEVLGQHSAAYPQIIATSSNKADGIGELRGALARVAAES